MQERYNGNGRQTEQDNEQYDKRNYSRSSYDRENIRPEFERDERDRFARDEVRREGWRQQSDDRDKEWYRGNDDDFGRPGERGWRAGRRDSEPGDQNDYPRRQGYASMSAAGQQQGLYGRTITPSEQYTRPQGFQYDEGFGGQGYGNQGANVTRTPQWNRTNVGKGPKNYKRSDVRIQEDVGEALSRHGAIDASDIEVKVDDGEVRLTGTVNSKEEKRLAEDLAEDVHGVKDVHNEIRIGSTSYSNSNGSRKK